MSGTPTADRTFGFGVGHVIQEYYVDDDADPAIRDQIESATGHALVGENYGDVVDGAVIWWRADDAEGEDLTDLLVDAAANLDNGGLVWVLTPKPGRPGHVRPAEIEEAAKTAGLHTTSAISAGKAWSGIRLTARGRQ
ncbi:MAG: DUF3052 domain-containing protein [Actinobacteria bacterium]|nr:DUF3052 domain-containing protein [Actinomycetota bacterium]